MDFAGRFIDHLRAPTVKVVDQIGNGLFVAGDKLGGQNDRVAMFEHDLLVVVVRDAHQGGQRFPLTAGGDDGHLFAIEVSQIPQLAQGIVGNLKIAELPGHCAVLLHAAAMQDDGAAAGSRGVHGLLDAVNVAAEG